VGQPVPSTSAERPKPAAWPTGRTRTADQLAVDPLEVSLVADYGAAPQNAVLTPLYAYRVYARRRILQRAIAEQHAALEHAEAERDTALAALASELRPLLEANDALKRLLEPVREVERLAGDRHAAFSQADAGYREQMASFDQQLGALGQAQSQAQANVTRSRAAADATESTLQRAEAKSKRVQIEIRGVMDVARQALGPAGGDIPAPQAAQLAELQARQKALEPELLAARAAHAATSAELERSQNELDRLQSQAAKLERQKAATGGGLEQQLSLRAAGVSDAEKQRRDALAEVARGVLQSRGGVALPEATVQALLAHDARVEAQALRLETHVRALDSQDHERVRQGVILALSAFGLVVLAITLKAVL
jgi:chromosome segregation ATPase